MTAKDVQDALQKVSSPEKAKANAWFFKTGTGEYGEGDKFIGVTVPEQRKVAKRFREQSLPEISKLLHSEIHEHRLTGLFILVDLYQRRATRKIPGDPKEIVQFYIDHRDQVDNWDLVDSSAHLIIGPYWESVKFGSIEPSYGDDIEAMVYRFARKGNLWEKRIAMIATAHFIRKREFDDALRIAEILVHEREDLLQKAVGWMLREIGKKDLKVEEKFLDKYYKSMPRTMLRYAIEKFTPEKKRHYMGASSHN